MLKEAIESIKAQTYSDYEIIEETGKGYGSFNNAIKKAKGEFILILGDDDKLPTDFLEVCVHEIEGYDIVSTKMIEFGSSNDSHLPETHPFLVSLFRRQLWKDVGGFDGDIGPALDVEFWWRCLQNGAKWKRTDKTFYWYRKHIGQDSNVCDWKESMDKIYKKHPNYTWL